VLFKIPLLLAVGTLWIRSQNIMLSAAVWGIAMLVISLLFNGLTLLALVAAALSFLICLGVLYLLDYTQGTPFHWIVAILGIGILIVV